MANKLSTYAYKHELPHEGTHGYALFSKYPIAQTKVLNNTSGLPIYVISELDISGKKHLVVNAHIASPAIAFHKEGNMIRLLWENEKMRRKQVEQLETYLSGQSIENIIMAGDMNTMPSEPLMRKLRNNWVDVYDYTNWSLGYNFPNSWRSKRPITRLDYILVKGHIKPIGAQIVKSRASDHHFVIGEIGI